MSKSRRVKIENTMDINAINLIITNSLRNGYLCPLSDSESIKDVY